MPQLPDKMSLGNGPELSSSRPIVSSDLSAPDTAEIGMGNQLESTGASIEQDAKLQQQKQGEFDALRGDSYFVTAHSQLLNTLKDDTDYSTLPGRYQQQADILKQNALDLVQNPLQKAKLDSELSKNIATGYDTIGTVARNEYRRQGADNYSDSFNSMSQLAQNAPDWVGAQAALDRNRELTYSAVNNHFITPVRGAILLKQQQTDTARAFFARDADADPIGARDALNQRLGEVPKQTIPTAVGTPPAPAADGSAPPASNPGATGPAAPAPPTTNGPSFSPQVTSAINTASKNNNVPADYMNRTLSIENPKGDPTAKNPNATSSGLYQFTDATAKQYGVTDKNDPNQSADAAAKLYNDNKASLTKSLGYSPPDSQVYLAHQQGAGGAAALLQNPEENAIQTLVDNTKMSPKDAKAAILNNGGTVDMTSGDFSSKWMDKYNNGSSDGTSSAGSQLTGKYAYLNYIPVPDVLQKRNALNKQIQLNQNSQQVASLQNTADVFNKVSDGSANLSDVLANPTLSDDQKQQAKALLLGNQNSATAAEALVGNAKIPKGANIQGLNNLDIQQEINQVSNKFNDPANAADKSTGEFFASRMQDYNNVMAKMNIARAVNQTNPGQGLSNAEYNVLMKKVKNDSQQMYNAVSDPEGHSMLGRMVDGQNTGFQVLTDKVKAMYPNNPVAANQMLGYAFTLAQQPDQKTGQPMDLFTPQPDQGTAQKNMQGLLDNVTQARKVQLGIPSSAPSTQAVIKDGQVQKVGAGDPTVKPAAVINPTVAPAKAPAGLPQGSTFVKYVKGTPYYKQPDGKFWYPI